MQKKVVLEGQLHFERLFGTPDYFYQWGTNLYQCRLADNIVEALLRDEWPIPVAERTSRTQFDYHLRITVEVLDE